MAIFVPQPATLLQQNIRAATYDVEYKYFASGCLLSGTSGLSAFTRNHWPTGWTRARDNITSSGSWFEITPDIQFEGQCNLDLNDNTSIWRASISGWGWAASRYDTGFGIVSLRKISNPLVLNDVLLLAGFDGTTTACNAGHTGTSTMHSPCNSGGANFRPGKYVRALELAPSTANLIGNPSFETNTTGWNTYNLVNATDFARTNVCALRGDWSASIVTKTGAISNCHYPYTTDVQGSYYGSAYVLAAGSADYGDNADIRIQITYSDASTDTGSYRGILSASWQRISASVATNSGKTVTTATVIIGDYSSSTAHSFYIDGCQLEMQTGTSARLTPYCDGAMTYGCTWAGTAHASVTTRTAASWAYNSACVLPAANTPGTIGLWFKADTNSFTDQSLLVAGSTSGSELAIRMSASGVAFDYGNVGAGSYVGSCSPLTWNHIAMTWNGSVVRGYLNGVQATSIASGYNNVTTGTCVHLGQDKYHGYNRGIGQYDDVFTLSRALLPTEVSAIYNRGRNEVSGNDWQLDWIGAVESYSAGALDAADDRFSLVIGGADATLGQTDAPRLNINKFNVAEEASVTVSSTLALPEMEVGLGEFIGTKQDVSPGNIVDGKMRTLWISNQVPTIDDFTFLPPPAHSTPFINEIYIKPHLGWSPDAWWIEIQGGMDLTAIATVNRNNELIFYGIPETGGERTVICGNRQLLDAMGGAPRASFILEATEATLLDIDEDRALIQMGGCADEKADFNLNPTDGFVAVMSHSQYQGDISDGGYGWLDYIQWGNPWQNQPGGVMHPNFIKRLYNWGCGWESGEADFDHGLNITNLPAGHSWVRKALDFAISDWEDNNEPTPGYRLDHRQYEWAKLVLPEHSTTLREDYIAGAGTIEINEDTLAWPSRGTGILENEAFIYTGKSGSALIGVTGISGNHYIDSLLYPTDGDGTAMSGYYLNNIEIKRQPGLANIKQARLFTSKWEGGATPDEDITQLDWIFDYDKPQITIDNNTPTGIGAATIAIDMKDRPNRWVRELLLVIDEMHNDRDGEPSRAKINELKVNLQGSQIMRNGNLIGLLAVSTVPNIVSEILLGYTWLVANGFIDATDPGTSATPNWGFISDFQTAVAPVVSVIADLARRAGCVVEWTQDARCRIMRDAWWPGGAKPPEYLTNLDDIRGEYVIQKEVTTVTGVAISGRDTQNDILARIVVPPGAAGSGLIEITDVTVANQAHAMLLANAMLNKEKHKDTLTLEIKGIGDILKPGGRIQIFDDTKDLGIWLVESVTNTWSTREYAKMYTTTLECRIHTAPFPLMS